MVQMEFLGMDFSCVFGSLTDGKFPEKDCLLHLISKLLGYAIVAAVKVPLVYQQTKRLVFSRGDYFCSLYLTETLTIDRYN
ncbi:mannose-P-dolichol utilization defect 1 protein homolog 2-like [Rutidosis leptorrhynchoides]|uniref:mannose-P-dolichol utilization defect 1 protein homolog 2-like n=1 Tax=Rutidosis leptorrhynchoides TaxID=125765 RepID=UPI003A99011F